MVSKSRPFKLAALLALVAFVANYHLHIVTYAGFLGTAFGVNSYHKSPMFLSYLRAQWAKLPEVDPLPFPEIAAENFTQELLWEVTDNLRRPVIIRGAIKSSKAVNSWDASYFLDHYPKNEVVVRDMRDQGRFRIVRVSMSDFWKAYDHGMNVSIIASSSIFEYVPELKEQVAAPFESLITDKSGEGVFVTQLFVTPGGTTFSHSEFGGNLFRQVSGQKKWTVISHEYSRYLCPHIVRGTATVRPCVQDFSPEEREAWFKRIPRMEVTLQPGDMIYNAPWYWHEVVAVGRENQQASVAGRIRNVPTSFRNGFFQALGVLVDQYVCWATGDGFEYPLDNVGKGLEDRLIDGWTKRCLEQGRNDCYGLPISS